MFEICDVLSDHLLGEPATGVIARFCSSLAALLLSQGVASLVVAPCQKAAKTHTHTRPTEVSRLKVAA